MHDECIPSTMCHVSISIYKHTHMYIDGGIEYCLMHNDEMNEHDDNEYEQVMNIERGR